jgi:hypothetical protein
VEFDGFKKYLRQDRGGLAVGDPEQVVWQEKQRGGLAGVGTASACRASCGADYWVLAASSPRSECAGELRSGPARRTGTDVSDLVHLIVRRSA